MFKRSLVNSSRSLYYNDDIGTIHLFTQTKNCLSVAMPRPRLMPDIWLRKWRDRETWRNTEALLAVWIGNAFAQMVILLASQTRAFGRLAIVLSFSFSPSHHPSSSFSFFLFLFPIDQINKSVSFESFHIYHFHCIFLLRHFTINTIGTLVNIQTNNWMDEFLFGIFSI